MIALCLVLPITLLYAETPTRLCYIFKVSVRQLCVPCTFVSEAIDSRVLVHQYPQSIPRLCISVEALVAAKLILNENLMAGHMVHGQEFVSAPHIPH